MFVMVEEVDTFYTENRTKSKKKNVELLIVKAGDAYSYHCALS
jgi:hypothetical protein